MLKKLKAMLAPPAPEFGPMAVAGQGGVKSVPATIAVASGAATLLLAANGNRVAAVIQNAHASTVLYIGKDSSVTSANGIALPAGSGWEDLTSTDAWYGRQASGTGDARVYEVSR